MKKIKSLSLNKIFAVLLMPLFVILTAFGFCFKDKKASALPAYPTSYIGPIYDFDNLNYSEEKLNELASAILGSGKTINNLIDYIKSDAQTDGLPVENKQITVAYGRYRQSIASTSVYNPLIWMPVYMSTTADGSDAVLTLYLGAVNGPRSSFEYGGFTQAGEYTTDPQNMRPSNMYGTSYMRASMLGNGGKYMNYAADHGSAYNESKELITTAEGNNKFLDFLKYTEKNIDGETVNSMGYLCEDIVAPSQMAWQAKESYKTEIGADGVFENAAYGGSAWQNYKFPNEAYGTSDGDYSNNNYNYSNIAGYDSWKNDKVWLPSLTEVGTGDNDGTNDDTNGLWKLTKRQKANNPTMLVPTTAAWLRTPNTVENCYSMFTLEQDGSVGTRPLSERNLQIRPAIHLNLSKIISKYRKPVNVPDIVSVQYNGVEQTLRNGEVEWMTDDITVSFYSDKEAQHAVAALDAGEYYLTVYLENASDYFAKLPTTQRYKTVKFIVEKKQIGVKWKYDGNKPSGIEMSTDSVIFERDILADNVPEIGIKYTSSTESGVTYYDYDDILKGSYYAEAYIIDDDKYDYNYVLSPDTLDGKPNGTPNPDKIGESLKSSTFAVGRKEVDTPYFVGTEPETLVHRIYYRGEQYVQLANVNPKYFDITVTPTSNVNNKCEYVGVSEQGYLTYKVSECDTYKFTFKFKNNNQFTWSDSGYVFAPSETGGIGGTETGVDTENRVLSLELMRAVIDVEFVNLPAEISSVATQTFSIAVHGVFVQDDENPLEFDIYYLRAGSSTPTYLTPNNGIYSVSNLLAGNYTMYASLKKGSAYLNNYKFEGNFKTQQFKVVKVVSEFNPGLIKWQYTHNNVTQGEYSFTDHDSEAKAIVFDYDGDFYQFSLTLGEAELKEKYYVKAVYTGDKFVKNAGSYCITVEIKAFYNNVEVQEITCHLYFKINPVKYDLSDLEWDYDASAPFTYNGAKKKVGITADSLANYPGLTVEYLTEGNRIDAGVYTTKAVFKIAQPYATNYVLPTEDDDGSYNGEFAFNCTWAISKAELNIEWNTPDSGSSSNLVYIPRLKVGHEYVNYVYERKVGSTWVTATELKADGAPETFRAKAVIKDEFAKNYEILANAYSGEFVIESGKQGVSVHYEFNGKIIEDGAEIPYTGEPITLTLVVDSGGLTIDSYEFKYYTLNGSTLTELSGEPFDIGEYYADVTARFNDNSYMSEGTPKIGFKIVKADYDPEQIWWIYEHGDTVIAAKYDKEQGKFVDEEGKEVEFSFEYDGTPHLLVLDLQQEFDDPNDRLTIDLDAGGVIGNSGTTANDYMAVVNFKYNSARYNSPYLEDGGIFPRTLNWKITKQKLDYNNVRWGFLGADGKEHGFNFEEDSFRFTRNEDGVVGYTVRLIGLPEGIQDLIRYETQNLMDVNGVPEVGNTRYSVGEYLTTFTISGTWTDPNYEDFDASGFPLTIPSSQIWKIKRRELSKIDYDGKWVKFDDRVHNVIDLCKIPSNELVYFKIEITLVDKLNNVYNDYQGYNGVANDLYHAGEYFIRFYELTGEEETPIIWDSIKITVEKNKLEVRWSLDGDYPAVYVKDIYATDMVKTVYTRANGAEVPLAYVKSTNGEEEFTATAKVTDAYKRNIEINELNPVKFVYKRFVPDENTKAIDKPVITNREIEYTGNPITFVIDAWDSYYSNYIYIADGNLTQTDVGTYYVVLRFYKKGAGDKGNAYWKDGSAINGDYNRESYTLSFTILPPTQWPLPFPVLENDYFVWTGQEYEVKISNWVALSRYITFEVFFNGESLGDNLFHRDAGLYTIIFTIPEDSIGYWKDDELDPKRQYTLQFTIHDKSKPIDIRYPTLDKTIAEYDGSEKQFNIVSWDGYFKNYITLECSDPNVRINGGTIIASIPGNYNIIAKTKEGFTFEGGKTSYSLTIGIKPPDGPDVEVPITKPSFEANEKDYTGEAVEFRIPGWAGTYAGKLELSCEDSSVVIDNTNGIIKVTNFGEYTIKISIKEGANVYWLGTEHDKSPFELRIRVNAPNDPSKAVQPSFKFKELQYNGKEQVFELVNHDSTKVMIVEGADALRKKEVGKYSITLRLINPDSVTWLDGTTEDIVISFEIIKAQISDVDIGEDGNPIIKDKDGNIIDFDISDILDVIYIDKNGNVVNKEDLIPGEKYTVHFVVKDQDKFNSSIDDALNLLDKINKGNEEGKYVINVYTPKPDGDKDDDKGGFNPLWWIAIAAAILAVIAIIGVIIGLATRRNGEGYNDGYGYDDYDDYDDEEDDDDYDDEYDDYDEYGDGYDDYGDGYDEY